MQMSVFTRPEGKGECYLMRFTLFSPSFVQDLLLTTATIISFVVDVYHSLSGLSPFHIHHRIASDLLAGFPSPCINAPPQRLDARCEDLTFI